ncbi:MAG TPA: molybdopterin-binding protein [Fastidiosipila sp.]|jgi:molybdenum cofactor synthesis domain-containing protein|nr:molybdopterin-binding protein [Fastidiosipila sp.]
MKTIRTEDAVGHVLCHDITRIVKDDTKGVAFRRGHVVTEADIPELLKLGKASLYVFEAKEGMLHENDAAAILYDISAGEHMTGSEVKEGKIDIYAAEDGLFQVDVERLKAVNRLGEMMIATRHTNSPVRKGDKLAGTRVIPLVIESGKMERARQVAGDVPLLRIHPYRQRKAAVVVTGSEVDKGLIRDTFTPVVLAKLKEYGIDDVPHRLVGDDPERTVQAIRDFLADGAEIVLCTGGMSVDPDDRTPLAIKTVAERVVRYGAPVLPGAMFMLGYAKEGQALIGLPGCVMFHGRTIFDIILPRILADLPITSDDIAALGHGGLCLNCDTCIFPNCALGAGV